MDKSILVGKLNNLKINRVSEPGIYLVSEDETEVLLPNAYVNNEMQIGDDLEVFIYTDSEDRLVATTLKPYLYLNEIGFLEIVDVAKFGYFVDIGLPKDILVPKNRQKGIFHAGTRIVLQLQIDDRTDRLIASQKFELEKKIEGLKRNDEVDILVYSKTPLGFKVVVNNKYEGLIYHSEIFSQINIGDRKKAYVKNIRPDNKMDIILQKIGVKVKNDTVLEILKENGGKLNFTYKSSAEDISDTFGISKKSFKATLTKLLSEDKIILDDNSIRVK